MGSLTGSLFVLDKIVVLGAINCGPYHQHTVGAATYRVPNRATIPMIKHDLDLARSYAGKTL